MASCEVIRLLSLVKTLFWGGNVYNTLERLLFTAEQVFPAFLASIGSQRRLKRL
jgi:hypothetical protein